ncbi:HAD superfamily hydrolase (TIGR01509 family) [Rhizobium halophytocola]|uniref:HAD superfamily hydrolase (TIGR01509 family) n=2 Tax=Rhizobium halophytocola TaxID=735519 RepID=A0ABS4DSU8_9HYPH|nr:HAD superfamily hydrolase (TIGR01509 family) [Rhizobium halophytocola]
MDEQRAAELFLGRSLSSTIAIAREQFGVHIDDGFLHQMRTKLYSRFHEELKPIDGIADALQALEDNDIDWCVASSSQPERIRLSLTITGILPRFAPQIFSATMVEHGKPAPDLFLHAAREMHHDPARCTVIEDSPAGITAARAAGMRVFAFTGGGHAQAPALREAVGKLNADLSFDAMGDLLHLVRQNDQRDGQHP